MTKKDQGSVEKWNNLFYLVKETLFVLFGEEGDKLQTTDYKVSHLWRMEREKKLQLLGRKEGDFFFLGQKGRNFWCVSTKSFE